MFRRTENVQVLVKEVDALVVSTLEQLLEEAAPNEADLSSIYVHAGEEKVGTADEVMGIPGGDVVVAVGPVLLHFLIFIAAEIYEGTRTAVAESAGKRILKYLKSKLHRRVERVEGKTATISEIASSLEQLGWSRERSLEVAMATWAKGEQMAQQMVDLN